MLLGAVGFKDFKRPGGNGGLHGQGGISGGVYTSPQGSDFLHGSHKNGLDFVPFDGYRAELHAGKNT